MKRRIGFHGLVFALLLMSGLFFVSLTTGAEEVSYTRAAELKDSSAYPGVYYTEAKKGDNNTTIGIPSIAKQNLESGPTTESPAIIMGAAVPYEIKTGPVEFTKIPAGSLYPPYSCFRYKIIEEANTGGGGGIHKKMSGFDGTYVIIRVDVSDIIKDAPAGSYLHVSHAGNKALMVQIGYDEEENKKEGVTTFADGLGNKTCVYSLDQGAASLKDTVGNDRNHTYVDVIALSSGTLVAGADTGSTDPNVISADFKLRLYVDQTEDYNPDLKYDPNAPAPTDSNAETHVQKVMKKYYDETRVSSDQVASYVIKGSDLELEVKNDEGSRKDKPEFWSLRKAMTWPAYNDSPIRMICEVPVLEGLLVDGSGQTDRKVILDVNSFDIQIANHQKTGAAGLTVKKAQLTIKDGFNTTGAELAVGNNATMSIQDGGKLIIDETCQLEVEYDAASTTAQEGENKTPQPALDCGVITVENGGEIENNGVITIEGTEGKPANESTPVVRDVKDAEFHINEGGRLVNKGCLLSYGSFFNLGTIVNSGRYSDVITSNDPDRGSFTYHRGIQVSWKDDVTQNNITMGRLMNGKQEDTVNTEATITNKGDIVLVPGIMENYGIVDNTESGAVYACGVDEAVIPITPTIDAPTITEKRIWFGERKEGWITNESSGQLKNAGKIAAANVEIVNNGRTGALTEDSLEDPDSDIMLYNFGTADNSGAISMYGVHTFGDMVNTGTVERKVVIEKNTKEEGRLTDRAQTKLTNVYNAAKTVEGDANIWTYSDIPTLSVSPMTQERVSGARPSWKVKAELNSEKEDTQYELVIVQSAPSSQKIVQRAPVPLNQETVIEGPQAPEMNGNVVYGFYLDGSETNPVYRTVKVRRQEITVPSAAEDLVYNGKEQALTTAGSAPSGSLEYRLGPDGSWTENVPTAKDAGTYVVGYRLAGFETEAGSVTVQIGKRPVQVSADDQTSTQNADLKELTYSISGLVEGESIDPAAIEISTNAVKTKTGKYRIALRLKGDYPNYNVSTEDGIYTVTSGDFHVVAKNKYGAYSDETTYTGYNIDLTVPEGAEVYYSTATPLTSENYKTDGTKSDLFSQPAGAGTHTVYYYVVSADGLNAAGGSKKVIIDKAVQKAPADLKVKNETYKNAGDGQITGLKPRQMEYRNINNKGTYQTAYYEYANVAAGTYLVRMMGDSNHYASGDTLVTVGEGTEITVEFDSAGGSSVDKISGLAVGDTISRPADPTRKGYTFVNWYKYLSGEVYDFDQIIADNIYLTAHWKINYDYAVSLAKAKKTKLIKAVTRPGGKAVIKWKKVSGISGYQIRYSLRKDFKKSVKKKNVKAGVIKTAFKGLKKGRVYYIQLRPYTRVTNETSGKKKTVLGKWSNIKKVKITK